MSSKVDSSEAMLFMGVLVLTAVLLDSLVILGLKCLISQVDSVPITRVCTKTPKCI